MSGIDQAKKRYRGAADRDIRDCSIPTPEADQSMIDTFKKIFSTTSKEDRDSAIAATTNLIIGHKSLDTLDKIGDKYQTLSLWLGYLSNQLLQELPTKGRIPLLKPGEVQVLMEKNEATLQGDTEAAISDQSVSLLASLSLLTYFSVRVITDQAKLPQYACEAINAQEGLVAA